MCFGGMIPCNTSSTNLFYSIFNCYRITSARIPPRTNRNLKMACLRHQFKISFSATAFQEEMISTNPSISHTEFRPLLALSVQSSQRPPVNLLGACWPMVTTHFHHKQLEHISTLMSSLRLTSSSQPTTLVCSRSQQVWRFFLFKKFTLNDEADIHES